ncbi:MAG: hypothetical protein HQL33_10945, partial [Alphaproteobacteria bacterium]|nr:hypothetical protein [Alphaproteobacteria bacterium]
MNHRLIGCCAAMALLAGCGTYDVKAINETQPTAGNDFTRALTGEYRDY